MLVRNVANLDNADNVANVDNVAKVPIVVIVNNVDNVDNVSNVSDVSYVSNAAHIAHDVYVAHVADVSSKYIFFNLSKQTSDRQSGENHFVTHSQGEGEGHLEKSQQDQIPSNWSLMIGGVITGLTIGRITVASFVW